jgi:hypothetical protein
MSRSLVLVALLVCTVGVLTGCVTDDPASPAAEPSNATSSETLIPWESSTTTQIGCLVGAGHYTAGVYSYACLPDEDLEPCAETTLPDRTSALSVTVTPEAVDTDEPGVGEYAISVFGPPDQDAKQTWTAPIEEATYEVEDPTSGVWGVDAISQGMTVSQSWDVRLEATGEAPPGQSPDLELGSCT